MNYTTFEKKKYRYEEESTNEFIDISYDDFNLIIPDYFSYTNNFNHLRVKPIYEEDYFNGFEFYMNKVNIKNEKNQKVIEIEMEFENQKHVLKISREPTNLSVEIFTFEYYIYQKESFYAKNVFSIQVDNRKYDSKYSNAINQIINIILKNDLEGTLLESKFIDILSNMELNNLFIKLTDKKYDKEELKILSHKYAKNLDLETQQKLSRYLMLSPSDNLYD